MEIWCSEPTPPLSLSVVKRVTVTLSTRNTIGVTGNILGPSRTLDLSGAARPLGNIGRVRAHASSAENPPRLAPDRRAGGPPVGEGRARRRCKGGRGGGAPRPP